MTKLPMHYCELHKDQEQAYLESRSKWARGNEAERQRKYDKTVRVRNEQKREQSKFYHTKQWRNLRQIVLERDHYLCQYCYHYGRITQAKTVDHIVPIEYDQSMRQDVSNLTVICGDCHRGKSEWERNYYGTGNQNTIKFVAKIFNINNLPDFQNGKNND